MLDPEHDPDEINLVIKAKEYSENVQKLMEELNNYDLKKRSAIPISTADGITLIKVKDLVSIEVNKNETTIHTLTKDYLTHERLYKLIDKLSGTQVVQISKSVAINLDHLIELEAGFSGTMVAKLTNRKEYVSRSFIPVLKKTLGL